MKSRLTVRIAGATLRAVSVGVALACGAGTSMAGIASLNITSFTVSAAEFSGNFVFATDAFQSYNLAAHEAGGLLGQGLDNFSAANWNPGANRLAQTTSTKATGNTVNFTDPLTQLTTAGFSLSAQATPAHAPPAQPNDAKTDAILEGAFVLLDGNDAPIGGTLTFDLFYDMSVSTPGSSPLIYSQAALNLLASSDAGDHTSFSDGLLSNNLTGGTGSVNPGHFSWTYKLAAGEAAYYTLSGTVFAVAAIPEPETYALMVLGLAGIGAATRRRRSQAEPDTGVA
jgi:hypothetical protein